MNDIKMIVRKLSSSSHFRNINKEYHRIYSLSSEMIIYFNDKFDMKVAFNYRRNIDYSLCIIYHFRTPTNYYLPKNY